MKKGFTLLEVMIVLVILATLTILSSQSIQQAIKNKIKIQDQVDSISQVRDSLKVMERDINLAFHFSDFEMEMKDLVKKKRLELCKSGGSTTTNPNNTSTTIPTSTTLQTGIKPGCDPNDPNDPLAKKSEYRVDPTTHFVGKDNELYFPTLNASRLSEGIAQADFIKVAYLIQSCRKPGQESGGSKNCLVRRSSTVVEGDITKGGENVVLLEDVSEFKLRYFGKGKQDWNSEWDTMKGDAIAKNRFPDAVEISLTVEKGEGEKKKKYSMQIVAPLRFPNNTYQDSKNAAAKSQAGAPGGGGSFNGGFGGGSSGDNP